MPGRRIVARGNAANTASSLAAYGGDDGYTLFSRTEVAAAIRAVAFRGDGISQRICGHVGDRIVTRERSCRIDRIELIDKATYEALLKGEKASVSGRAGTEG